MNEEQTTVVLQAVIQKQEIRGVIHQFPSGPVEGYEWRLLLAYPATQTSAPRTEWTKWVFGSHQVVEQMLAQWNEYLKTHGHLSGSVPPGKSAH